MISVPTCQTVGDLKRSILSGTALIHLDSHKIYVVLYDTRLEAASLAEPLLFTGWCRLTQREVVCRVEVDCQTLQGYLSLGKEMRSAD